MAKVPRYRREHVMISNDRSSGQEVQFGFSRSEAERRELGSTKTIDHCDLSSSRAKEQKQSESLLSRQYKVFSQTSVSS